MSEKVVEVGETRTIDAGNIRYLYRKQGNPIEEARFLETLLGEEMTQNELASQLGISQGHISRRLRLLTLTKPLQRRVEEGDLRPRTAYILTRLSKEEQQAFEKQEKVTQKEAEATVRDGILSDAVMALLEDQQLPPVSSAPIPEALIEELAEGYQWAERYKFAKVYKPLAKLFEVLGIEVGPL